MQRFNANRGRRQATQQARANCSPAHYCVVCRPCVGRVAALNFPATPLAGRLLSGSSSRAHTTQSLQQSLRGCNPLKHIHPARIHREKEGTFYSRAFRHHPHRTVGTVWRKQRRKPCGNKGNGNVTVIPGRSLYFAFVTAHTHTHLCYVFLCHRFKVRWALFHSSPSLSATRMPRLGRIFKAPAQDEEVFSGAFSGCLFFLFGFSCSWYAAAEGVLVGWVCATHCFNTWVPVFRDVRRQVRRLKNVAHISHVAFAKVDWGENSLKK